jgi:hypothetical protein
MRIKRIKTRSQKITSSRYLKKNSESKNRCWFRLLQKNLIELSSFTKTQKRGARHVFGRLFYFYNLNLGFRTSTDGRDLSFKTSTNEQMESRFQDLNRWDINFKTSTDGQTGYGFQALDRQTHRLTELICMIWKFEIIQLEEEMKILQNSRDTSQCFCCYRNLITWQSKKNLVWFIRRIIVKKSAKVARFWRELCWNWHIRLDRFQQVAKI